MLQSIHLTGRRLRRPSAVYADLADRSVAVGIAADYTHRLRIPLGGQTQMCQQVVRPLLQLRNGLMDSQVCVGS